MYEDDDYQGAIEDAERMNENMRLYGTIDKPVMLTCFEKIYDGESMVDVFRDVSEAFDEDYNSLMSNIPKDEHHFLTGRFKVKIEWIPE